LAGVHSSQQFNISGLFRLTSSCSQPSIENGIQEVGGSIPPGSTNSLNGLAADVLLGRLL
jgi:hypothetical protein